jgi:dihydroflavonol-4-reductase
MRVAVTGASGLVGTQVVRAALEAGHDVRAIVRSTTVKLPDSPVERVRADLDDDDGLRAALAGMDGLVHCAAVYAFGAERAAELTRVNVQGTKAVLTAAARVGVSRAVVTSSAVTCGSSSGPQVRGESDRLGGERAPGYYASKVAQEQAALEVAEREGMSVVLALPSVVLGGPYTELGPSNAIVLRFLLDPSRSTFAGGANIVDARTVGRGHVQLLQSGRSGERYVLGGENLTWRALHALVAQLTGLPGPYADAPAPLTWAVSAIAEKWADLVGVPPLSTREEALTVGRYYWYSSDKAAALGYQPGTARQAVASSLAWLAVGHELPRWARESLTFAPEVRAARDLTPRPLPDGPSFRP